MKERKTMPSESNLKQKIILEFKRKQWVYWFPVRSRYGKEKDIFGVFDAVCINKFQLGKIIFVQMTTASNISARVKKIKCWLISCGLGCLVSNNHFEMQVWGWDKKTSEFKKVLVDSI